MVYGGDLNVFPRPDDPIATGSQPTPSDQLAPLYEAGLHNLWDNLVADVPASAYSYSFEGQAQTLDHLFVNDALYGDLVQVRAAHINADWPAEFTGDGSRGSSDHDPQVARFRSRASLTVADTSVVEGDQGTRQLTFTATRVPAAVPAGAALRHDASASRRRLARTSTRTSAARCWPPGRRRWRSRCRCAVTVSGRRTRS